MIINHEETCRHCDYKKVCKYRDSLKEISEALNGMDIFVFEVHCKVKKGASGWKKPDRR